MPGDKGEALFPTVSNERHQISGHHSSSSEAEDDPDYTSSSGSSSGDDEDEDVDEKRDVTTHHNQTGRSVQETVPPFQANQSLKSRLTAFLPQIEQSNRELDVDGRLDAKRIDDVDEQDEQYIEMNLGLGVLSEQSETSDDVKVHGEHDKSDDELDSDDEADTTAAILGRSKSSTQSSGKKKIEEIDSS